MARKPIDLAAVRLARANLRRLAREHPELRGEPGDANRAGWERTLETMAENDEQIVIRLPGALVERVDAHVERLRAEQPGLRITRSDAVRMLLSKALEAVEPGRGKRKK